MKNRQAIIPAKLCVIYGTSVKGYQRWGIAISTPVRALVKPQSTTHAPMYIEGLESLAKGPLNSICVDELANPVYDLHFTMRVLS